MDSDSSRWVTRPATNFDLSPAQQAQQQQTTDPQAQAFANHNFQRPTAVQHLSQAHQALAKAKLQSFTRPRLSDLTLADPVVSGSSPPPPPAYHLASTLPSSSSAPAVAPSTVPPLRPSYSFSSACSPPALTSSSHFLHPVLSSTSLRPRASTASAASPSPSPSPVASSSRPRTSTTAFDNDSPYHFPRGGLPHKAPNMFPAGQRHVSGNDPSRAYQVPPPPPPPVGGPNAGQMNNMMNLPPPPPRYPPIQGASGVMIPPPPGPPPASALGQQPPWHGTFGRMYDGRPGFSIPPPPPGQHQPYNPKLHAQIAAGQTVNIPPPPPPNERVNEQMSATYIPQGDTYGEGVGIPAFGLEDPTLVGGPRPQWPTMPPQGGTEANATAPMDDAAARERYYASSNAQHRGISNSSNATAAGAVSADIAAQWPLDTVLIWLAKNQFSKDWQETFKALNLQGTHFLELGSGHGGRGNFGMMHQQVYPKLAQECTNSGTGWDQPREREEGKRMRRLIRTIVIGRPADTPKMTSSHSRKESLNGGHGNNPPSAGTDHMDSPNVRLPFFNV